VPAAGILPPQPAAPRPPLIGLLTVAGCQPAAEQLRFLGSPTIRVNGHDIEPGADRQQEYVHAWRLHHGLHSLQGLPEADWLRQALLTAARNP
jgi:hypothetical protein